MMETYKLKIYDEIRKMAQGPRRSFAEIDRVIAAKYKTTAPKVKVHRDAVHVIENMKAYLGFDPSDIDYRLLSALSRFNVTKEQAPGLKYLGVNQQPVRLYRNSDWYLMNRIVERIVELERAAPGTVTVKRLEALRTQLQPALDDDNVVAVKRMVKQFTQLPRLVGGTNARKKPTSTGAAPKELAPVAQAPHDAADASRLSHEIFELQQRVIDLLRIENEVLRRRRGQAL
jgi:hypothetical protein